MEILKNVDLIDNNTFKLPSISKYFCKIENINDIKQLIKSPEFVWNKSYMLWLWANTIFPENFNWIVIKNEIKWKNILDENENSVSIKVWAGEVREDFVIRCAKNNYVWMENLAHIPSSVWATAVQNIWAYWSEAKDIISQVEYAVYDDNWKVDIKTIAWDDCKFWYRDSIFKHELKNNIVILSVTYKLKKYTSDYQFKKEYSWIQQKIQESWLDIQEIKPLDFVNIITEIRNSKLPDWKEIWTAWSFFKNPVISPAYRAELHQKYPELKWFDVINWIKLSAGQLIDMCWFKWKSNWKVWTYFKHALILVNEWWASWSDVLSFSSEIQTWVYQKFWVQLDPEAIFVQ